MASNIVHCISRDVDIHGVGNLMVADFTNGVHFSIKQVEEGEKILCLEVFSS